MGMQGCIGQVRELDLTVRVRGINEVVDDMGGGECHTLILLNTPSYGKNHSICPNESLKTLPKERGRI